MRGNLKSGLIRRGSIKALQSSPNTSHGFRPVCSVSVSINLKTLYFPGKKSLMVFVEDTDPVEPNLAQQDDELCNLNWKGGTKLSRCHILFPRLLNLPPYTLSKISKIFNRQDFPHQLRRYFSCEGTSVAPKRFLIPKTDLRDIAVFSSSVPRTNHSIFGFRVATNLYKETACPKKQG